MQFRFASIEFVDQPTIDHIKANVSPGWLHLQTQTGGVVSYPASLVEKVAWADEPGVGAAP